MSDTTKQYRVKYWVCRILSILLNFGPLIGYGVYAFIIGTPQQKLALGGLLTIAIILTAINIIFKYHLRCIIWILLIGVYIAVKQIIPLLLIIAACTIIDDLVLEPLCKTFKNKLTINKEIDKRIPNETKD